MATPAPLERPISVRTATRQAEFQAQMRSSHLGAGFIRRGSQALTSGSKDSGNARHGGTPRALGGYGCMRAIFGGWAEPANPPRALRWPIVVLFLVAFGCGTAVAAAYEALSDKGGAPTATRSRSSSYWARSFSPPASAYGNSSSTTHMTRWVNKASRRPALRTTTPPARRNGASR
jgi:hypothetical protein